MTYIRPLALFLRIFTAMRVKLGFAARRILLLRGRLGYVASFACVAIRKARREWTVLVGLGSLDNAGFRPISTTWKYGEIVVMCMGYHDPACIQRHGALTYKNK